MKLRTIESHQHQKLAAGLDRISTFSESIRTLASECRQPDVASLAADLGTVAGKLRSELESIASKDEWNILSHYRRKAADPLANQESLNDYDLSEHKAATRSLSR